MARSLTDEDRLVQYLLGVMPEEERAELEELYLRDDDVDQEIQAVERELIDSYLEGSLTGEERDRFESFFLCSPGRTEKLRFARALRTYGSRPSSGDENALVAATPGPLTILRSFARSNAGIGLFVVLAIALAFVIWRAAFFRSPDQQALLALSKAYHNGRLFESRVSGLDYAPLAQARGDGKTTLDTINLSQAELIALKEAADHPGSTSFHTLGRVYLTEQRFDEALEWLRKAAASNPEDAAIHSDLAAALMEHGRQNPNPEKRAEELTETFSHLEKALELDDSLREARFNRALWYEYMHLPERAKAEWQSYLQKDPNSGWADEARRRLALLEERQSQSHVNKERDFEEFVTAATAGDEATAWKVLSRNRDRSGNTICQRLIDEYLESAVPVPGAEAGARLRMISLAGRVELEQTGDRFTADLAGYYLKATPGQRMLAAQGRGSLRPAFECYRKAAFENAAKLYSQAQVVLSKAGNECEAAVAQAWVGACYLRLADTARALAIFHRLAALSSTKAYRLLLAQSLTNIADALASRREFSKSLDTAAVATEIFENIQDVSGALRSLQAPVLMHRQFGEFYKSIGFAIHGLDVARSLSPGPLEVWPFYQHIAFNLNSLDLPTLALEFHESALRLAMESGAPLLKSRSYAQLALIHQKLRKPQDALNDVELALGEARAVEGERIRMNLIANSTLHLAHVYREMGAFSQALSYYDEAIQLHEQMNVHAYAAEAHWGRLQALAALKDDRAIGEEIKASISLLEQDRPRILEDGNRNSFFNSVQGTYDLAIDFAYSHLNDIRAAFNYSESSHARSLLDLVSAGGEVINGKEGSDIHSRGVTQSLSLAEIQQRLPEHSRILQYSVLEDKVIAWVISRKSVESAYRAVTPGELTREVTAFLDALTRSPAGDGQDVNRKAKALYEILIRPISPRLEPGGVVFIVPDKILNYVPFGALVCPESGKYFIEECTFELAPSASIMIGCSDRAVERGRQREERVLAVGNPSFDRVRFPSLPDLPSAAREAESVASLYGDVPLIGPEAQAHRVKARIVDADVIHLAGHYVADERSPMLSRFLLSNAGHRTESNSDSEWTLQASEVYGFKLRRARLVVLSGCGTGVERYYRGEGAIGIARPFMEAGAPLVVASLWPVDSEQTSQLMIDFHRRRKLNGMSAALALRQAQLDMLSSAEPSVRHPHAWAAFVTIGGFAQF
jgi:CHAT domain-containing protein/tetratricopeptide (TPR) repeat protein